MTIWGNDLPSYPSAVRTVSVFSTSGVPASCANQWLTCSSSLLEQPSRRFAPSNPARRFGEVLNHSAPLTGYAGVSKPGRNDPLCLTYTRKVDDPLAERDRVAQALEMLGCHRNHASPAARRSLFVVA